MGSEEILDGVVYGNLMKGYFLKGMETEAMECYKRVLGEGSPVKMSAVAYNYILEALSKNGKFEEALNLFQRMKDEHNPPRKLSVNLGSYNIIVDGYCAEKRFSDAIEVFNSMGEKRCSPDTLIYNVLIDQLCSNDKLAEAEELYKGMGDKKVGRLVKVGKVDEAKSFFDLMVPKLRMNDDAYKFIMNALFEVGKHDEVLRMVDGMLREDPNDFTEEVEEFVREGLRKEGREDEVTNLKLDIEREKAEAAAKAAEEAERAKASARTAIASLLPSKLFGDKDNENKDAEEESSEAAEDAATTSFSEETEMQAGEGIADETSAGVTSSNDDVGLESAESVGNGVSEQGTA
ncbi:UNVERIFIED_CONTAM: Pentatricopeptide repeat-containing protein, mitochondrial [Sesamum latifolium]|uniref:Pentatricopeptide repeat-containing protein, mitochondrial n=1 Tax=Sesamum latifolium TaxID=2727402 RepID=A0AAW2T869_9LAMI